MDKRSNANTRVLLIRSFNTTLREIVCNLGKQYYVNCNKQHFVDLLGFFGYESLDKIHLFQEVLYPLETVHFR